MCSCGIDGYLQTTMIVVMLMTVMAVPMVTSSPARICQSVCTCRWKGGKETVECVNKRLGKIPSDLGHNTQVLDLSHNNLGHLGQEAFSLAGLTNLQKVCLTNCNLRRIDDNAFRHLANLVELHLSNNLLIAVPSETFVDYPELRRLHLNHNTIRRIESSAFSKLPYLAVLELSGCLLEYLGPRAFGGLSHLKHLKLDGNRLTTLTLDADLPLRSLHSVDLFGNPWRCDCRLRALRNWLYNDELPINAHPTCAEPPSVSGVELVGVPPSEFACPPSLQSSSSTSSSSSSSISNSNLHIMVEVVDGKDARIHCRVSADPEPKVTWTAHGKTVRNLTRFSTGTMYVVHDRGNVDKTSILTVSSAREDDSGEYLCIAHNSAGTLTLNFTLEVKPDGASDLSTSGIGGNNLAGLIGSALACLGVIATALTVLLAWKSHRNRRGHCQSDDHKVFNCTNDDDSKKENSHLVNHVKFDVDKEKLELTDDKCFYKPLCAIGEAMSKETSIEVSGGDTYNSFQYRTIMPRSNSCGGSANTPDTANRPDVVSVCHNTQLDLSPVERQYSNFIGGGSGNGGRLMESCWTRVDGREKTSCHLATLPRTSARSLPRVATATKSVAASVSSEDGIMFGEGKSWVADSAQEDVVSDRTIGLQLQQQSRERLVRNGRGGSRANRPPPVPPKRYGATSVALGNSGANPVVKHSALMGRHFVPVLPPLAAHHFAQARDSPDEGYEDEVVLEEAENL